jgi:myo-inositol-1(or 4)-monophosphatase
MIIRSATLKRMMGAASKAGEKLAHDFRDVRPLQVWRKGSADLVSTADKDAEETIRDELLKAHSDYGLLMEESGSIEGRDRDHRFIVDPLDGTINFLHGQPHFSVSIALEEHGEIVSGCIYDPIKNEMFTAERGKGSFLNDHCMKVSSSLRLCDSVFSTGIPFLGNQEGEGHKQFLSRLGKVMAKAAGVRSWGAASLDLAYVAAGRYDGFWERGLHFWDVAAGALMVREAGGIVTDAEAGQFSSVSRDIVATNGKNHDEFIGLLRDAM